MGCAQHLEIGWRAFGAPIIDRRVRPDWPTGLTYLRVFAIVETFLTSPRRPIAAGERKSPWRLCDLAVPFCGYRFRGAYASPSIVSNRRSGSSARNVSAIASVDVIDW